MHILTNMLVCLLILEITFLEFYKEKLRCFPCYLVGGVNIAISFT